jgi:hypothetical protein
LFRARDQRGLEEKSGARARFAAGRDLHVRGAARSTNPATRLRCSAEISGPISTPSSVCAPTLSERTAALKSATSRS